jgi:hypothetical protein
LGRVGGVYVCTCFLSLSPSLFLRKL